MIPLFYFYYVTHMWAPDVELSRFLWLRLSAMLVAFMSMFEVCQCRSLLKAEYIQWKPASYTLINMEILLLLTCSLLPTNYTYPLLLLFITDLKLDLICSDSFLSSYVMSVQTASSVGKVEVCLRKVHKAKWTQVGQPLESHDSFIQSKHRGESTACPFVLCLNGKLCD